MQTSFAKRATQLTILLMVLVAIGVAIGATGCPGPTQPTSPGPTGPGELPASGDGAAFEGTGTFVGAADIADCEPGAEATAKLLDEIPGTVFAVGDLAYPDGSAKDFANCYTPTWGRHRARTRAVPGNHEYQSPGARPFFDYFGPNAGPPGLGYYAFRVHAWKVLALNSEADARPSSPQMQWLRAELTGLPATCTLAMWHRPLFTSGPNRPNYDMRDMFRLLHEFGVEIVLSGHEHLYERFAPQDADGRPDPDRGVRQFIVGTGGASHYTAIDRQPNSETAQPASGVLKLTLAPGRYAWEFVSVPGSGFRDEGMGLCHL